MHDEFLCHVTAYGVSRGERIGVPLGTYRAPTLALALWWLRDRATWIAERLDPRPENEHFPVHALAPLADSAPDVPLMLRAWRDNRTHQERVAEHLAAGHLIRVATRDETTEYELLAESVDALRMERAAPSPITPVSVVEPPDYEYEYGYAYANVNSQEDVRELRTPADVFTDTLRLGRLPE